MGEKGKVKIVGVMFDMFRVCQMVVKLIFIWLWQSYKVGVVVKMVVYSKIIQGVCWV